MRESIWREKESTFERGEEHIEKESVMRRKVSIC